MEILLLVCREFNYVPGGEWHELVVTVKMQPCRCQLTAKTSNEANTF